MKLLSREQMKMVIGGAKMACIICGTTTNDVKCLGSRSGFTCLSVQSGADPSGNLIQCSNSTTGETTYTGCSDFIS
jgi:hypothetical protein